MKKHWFNCKVSYMKLNPEGTEGKKNEQFILDAYTYTEAETRMVEILESQGIRPFEITKITKTNLTEVIRFADCDNWFKVKVALTTVDESKGTEKEANQFLLISAEDVKDAFEKVKTHMNKIQVGYLITSIIYQKVVEVFPIEEWMPEKAS